MQGIYYIKNTVSGKIYVGQSVDIEARKQGHIYDLQGQRHKNHDLQADFDQYGLDVFEFGILEEVEGKADLEAREVHWIKRQKNCYNKVNWRPVSRMGDMPKILRRIRAKGIEQAKDYLGE